MAALALVRRDDGTENVPGTDSPWDAWVSATATWNFCHEDPCLDWLDRYGLENGFAPDSNGAGYDPRTDFGEVIKRKGREFELAVMKYLRGRIRIEQVADDSTLVRDRVAAERTFAAMQAGTEGIAQAILWNPQNQTYGIADLLVRSDVLARLFPSSFVGDDPSVPAPDLGGCSWHYRVVDIKLTTLHLLKDGHGSSDHLNYMVQVYIYNEALGRLQGFTPPSGYLLGRGWQRGDERGRSATERLARVDRLWKPRRGHPLAVTAASGCAWIRKLRAEGSAWRPLPTPSVDELRPNLRNSQASPWEGARRKIATELADLTMLPGVSPADRASAIASGLLKWSDPECAAIRCGVTSEKPARLLDAVIHANHSAEVGPIVFPARVTANEGRWRTAAQAEFFVDFETVNDINEDFSTFPEKGGEPLIFMIGCGGRVNGDWAFRCFTARSLSHAEEGRIISEWLDHVRAASRARGADFEDARLYHWSPAEKSFLATAYNAAARRHGLPAWNDLPWIDLWKDVVKAEPVTVRGAFGFGLKAIAKAMHAHGLIATSWGDGPTDGLGAMAAAWSCDAEASERGVPMADLPLMKVVETYNDVDCKVMAELLEFLRSHR